MLALLRVEGLEKNFTARRNLLGRVVARVPAVQGVSFDLGAGETLALVGESGAGKSTVGRLVLRLVEPDAGSVQFEDTDVLALPRRELRRWRRRAQMIFQDPFTSLNPRMLVGEAVAEGLVLHESGLSYDERRLSCEQVFEKVGLRSDMLERYPFEFSGGQLQRVVIARALITNPSLIVCDEPVSALDVSVRAQVVNLLRDLQSELGLAYLFIGHDLSLIRVIAHRVAVMYQGRIVESAPTDTLFRRPQHPYTVALLDAVPIHDPRHRRVGAQLQSGSGAPMPSPGCAFAPKCPHVFDRCWHETPELVHVGGGTTVACHLVQRDVDEVS
ncbi:MAG: ABC transporter ATP-binding protein [Acidimicrobiia bacterium]